MEPKQTVTVNKAKPGKDTNSPSDKHKQSRLAKMNPQQVGVDQEQRKRTEMTLVNLSKRVTANLSLNISLEEVERMHKAIQGRERPLL
jgi:hypothetical protein